ncbi:Protein of unknown function [Arsukibacterium tuosuense]|uniref:DUF3667 domain-containing protein n=1 Tax=Arsukibacterium tuosuense TaxID=1323745 RepID=A0A285ISA0_9GAMM|nr:DUF3667 domain-containing protein [Arsukibacterium tuosuense]SNY50872.1 Protein of unknown function [Arsukibacterium tuosuense]
MDTSEQRYCDNCNSALHGEFCHQCGQEKKSYIRNVSGVVTEFFGEFSNWDTRLWRTLIPLWFRPGYLSLRYVGGHRVPFVPPLRLYLFTSIIAFLIFARLLPDTSADVSAPDNVLVQPTVQPKKDAPPDTNNLSEIATEINKNFKESRERSPSGVKVSFLSDEGQQEFNAKLDAIIANPKLAINKFFSLAPQMMFLLLPIFALLLKLLYIRSNRYYMEHLIVALHSHSFILQMSVIYLGLGALQNSIGWNWLATIVGWLETAAFWWIPLYLFLCQKFYYRQGWGKTLLKFWLTSSLYNVLFISAVMALIVLSILWA